MRMLGLTSILLAAGLALAGPAVAQSGAAPAATAPAAAEAAAAPAKPADPTLNADGTPKTAPIPGIGQPVNEHIGLQKQVTPNGQEAMAFHNGPLFILITAISVFVLALLLIVIVRFNRRANPVPSKTSHNTTLEVLWTGLPVLILAVIAIYSIRLLRDQYTPAPANAVTLKAIGNQWYWTYEYPDNGDIQLTANLLKEKADAAPGERYRTDADGPRLLATDQRVVLPVGVPIRLVTTATDVIHSWAIPAFWTKLDAVPGKLNETTFLIEKPGVYFGQCSELCGQRHGYMPIAVEAVEPAEFAEWVHAHGGTMPGEASAENVTAAAAADNQAADANATAGNGQ